MEEDQILRNIAQSINGEDKQDGFNYWVRRLAYFYKTTTDYIQELVIVKQENMVYTGEFYDYKQESMDGQY